MIACYKVHINQIKRVRRDFMVFDLIIIIPVLTKPTFESKIDHACNYSQIVYCVGELRADPAHILSGLVVSLADLGLLV